MRRLVALLAITGFALTLAPTAAAGGGGCYWESSKMTEVATADEAVTAPIAGCRYEPTTLYIEPGTTVTWINKDPLPHSVTGAFLTINGEGLLQQGDEASTTFDEAGVFPYYCVLHPGMAGAVVVGDPNEGMSGILGPSGVSGTYDADAPVVGASELEPTEGSATVPIAAGVAAITLVGAGAAGLFLRRRRRALPVPGALP